MHSRTIWNSEAEIKRLLKGKRKATESSTTQAQAKSKKDDESLDDVRVLDEIDLTGNDRLRSFDPSGRFVETHDGEIKDNFDLGFEATAYL
jgi:hypothetical protein